MQWQMVERKTQVNLTAAGIRCKLTCVTSSGSSIQAFNQILTPGSYTKLSVSNNQVDTKIFKVYEICSLHSKTIPSPSMDCISVPIPEQCYLLEKGMQSMSYISLAAHNIETSALGKIKGPANTAIRSDI